jgi:hypothetical protein
MKRTLMIEYCPLAKSNAFLVGYVKGDPLTAHPDNFSCPYRNEMNGSEPLCCKERSLEKCFKFSSMVEHVKTLKDSDKLFSLSQRPKHGLHELR